MGSDDVTRIISALALAVPIMHLSNSILTLGTKVGAMTGAIRALAKAVDIQKPGRHHDEEDEIVPPMETQ